MSNWHILGAGAIGCLFAAKFSQSGTSCQLVLREPVDDNSCELLVEGSAGRHSYYLPASTCADDAPIERLLITTKAYDVAAALNSVLHRLSKESQVVIMVNGMGLVEIATAMLPHTSLFAATTTEGAWRSDKLTVHHAGHGITRVGATCEPATQTAWFSDWQATSLECQWHLQIEDALWHKLAINCAINPLTAIHQCRNGELSTGPGLQRQVEKLCDEIAAVSAAAGFKDTAKSIHQDAGRVIDNTANNKSSMLQDVLAGRRTEIDFITGYLVQRAKALDIPINYNEKLLQRVRQLVD